MPTSEHFYVTIEGVGMIKFIVLQGIVFNHITKFAYTVIDHFPLICHNHVK